MRDNINWDVCPDWVRFSRTNARSENVEQSEVCCREESGQSRSQRGRQTHVHEFLGSTKLEDENGNIHNHRFAGVSGEAIPERKSHIHKIRTRTDVFDHFHEIEVSTGPAIDVRNGKHVHFVKGETTFNDGHDHDFQFATLIESPLLPR